MNIFGRRTRDADRDQPGRTDEQAIERYRYMLATAPPDDIERAHEEAFAALSPEQRREVLGQLSEHVPASELSGDDPASLARAATRAELRQPGTMERAFGSGGGGGFASSFLPILAASFIGSAIAHQFFADDTGYSGDGSTSDGGGEGSTEAGYGGSDAGADSGGDFGGGDFGGF